MLLNMNALQHRVIAFIIACLRSLITHVFAFSLRFLCCLLLKYTQNICLQISYTYSDNYNIIFHNFYLENPNKDCKKTAKKAIFNILAISTTFSFESFLLFVQLTFILRGIFSIAVSRAKNWMKMLYVNKKRNLKRR